MDEKQTNQIPEENNENNQPPVEKDERDYFERQYFSGDALKEEEPAEEEDEEIYKSFKQVGGRKKAKMPTGRKARIIVLTSLFLVAAILFGVYELVLKNSGNKPDFDVYQLSANCYNIIGQINNNVEIVFKDTKAHLEADKYGKFVLAFARTFEYEFESVKVIYGEGTAYCTVRSGTTSVPLMKPNFSTPLRTAPAFPSTAKLFLAMPSLR